MMRHRQVEAAVLHKHKRQEVATALAHVLIEARLVPPHAAAAAGGAPDPALQQRLANLVMGLQAAAPTLPCPWDATLPADPARHVLVLFKN